MRRGPDEAARERLGRLFPALDAAHQLRFGSDGTLRGGVEGYLLAGVSPPEVDTRFRLLPGTVQCFTEQFFDVQGCLEAHDYLINVVIKLHARPLSMKDTEVFLQLFGLTGGRHVVDEVLDYWADPVRLPLDLDAPDRERRQRLRRRLEVHTSLLLHCLPEGSVSVCTWTLLERLVARRGEDRALPTAGVRLDVSDYIARVALADSHA